MKGYLINLGFAYKTLSDKKEIYTLYRNKHKLEVLKNYNTIWIYLDDQEQTFAQNGIYIIKQVEKLLKEL